MKRYILGEIYQTFRRLRGVKMCNLRKAYQTFRRLKGSEYVYLKGYLSNF